MLIPRIKLFGSRCFQCCIRSIEPDRAKRHFLIDSKRIVRLSDLSAPNHSFGNSVGSIGNRYLTNIAVSAARAARAIPF
jgi:hypothetical protein